MAKKSKKKDKSAKSRKASTSGAPAQAEQNDAHTAAITEKRRVKLRTAHEAALAAAELTGLDEQLEITNAKLRGLESRRAAAEQRLLDLHNAIGSAQLTKARVRAQRKEARVRSSAAQERSITAERRYDSAVLAQLLDSELASEDRDEQSASVS